MDRFLGNGIHARLENYEEGTQNTILVLYTKGFGGFGGSRIEIDYATYQTLRQFAATIGFEP